MIQTILSIVLAVGGFFVAKYIRRHKKQNKPLVCPIKFDCHTVVHSDYSKFFGVPVEILGMTYYAFTAVFYSFIFILNSAYELPESIAPVLLPLFALMPLLALAAFLFSVYLIGVQIFILKKGCSWCIVSAIISAIIFALVFFF